MKNNSGSYNQNQQLFNKKQMGMGQRNTDTDVYLIHDISTAIMIKQQAYHFYQKLAELAENEQQKRIILGIQKDEVRHYREGTMILRRLGGEQSELPVGKAPDTFAEGIKTAIENETIAAAFYEDIAWRAFGQSIKRHFTHASHEEQHHAALFQSMQAGLKEKTN